jgi:hypothetical protein
VALPKIGFNEGSLLRRTLLHVGTFVLGSVAFIGIVSFLLVSIAKGIVSPRAGAAEEEGDTAPVAAAGGTATPKTSKPATRPARLKRPVTVPGASTAQPSNDD